MRVRITRARGTWAGTLLVLLALSGCGGSAWPDILAALRGSRTSEDVCEVGTVRGGVVEEAATEPVAAPKKKAWQDAFGGEVAARPHVRARLKAWPARLLADRNALPQTDDEFLTRLARDTWNGLDAFTDRHNGLPVDNVRFPGPDAAPDEARVGDYTNITNVGLYMVAVVGAQRLGLLPRPEAVARLQHLLGTLESLETHEGFFFNYYDTTSLERTSNFLSFVDSSWLTAGLIVTRTGLPELQERCTRLIERMDYRLFYDAKIRQMAHGYYVHRDALSRYHYRVLYSEARLGSLIAVGRGQVPEEHWFAMVRTFPPACSWQTQEPRARRRKTVRGHAFTGGVYAWKDIAYVPSWGGSMFEALMPTLVLDEPRHATRSLGANDLAHALVQRRYALEELGYPVWGMSPSATPAPGGYAEHGVPALGLLGYAPGMVTPHASALALGVAAREAAANLRELAGRYEIYGPYGFYDAVDPRSGEVAYAYLALDQAMTFIAAVNALRAGEIQSLFAADPIAQRALPVIGAENFFD